MKIFSFLNCIFLFLFVEVTAQTYNSPQGRAIEEFPYPYEHYTFIQPRFDRTNYENGGYFNAYALRAAKAFYKNNHIRLEVPLATSNLGGCAVTGLADVGLRYVHASPIHGQLYAMYGAEFIFPTATDEVLGSGKWQAHPEAGMIYFLGSPDNVLGTISLGGGYKFDYAGSSSRPHINVWRIAPNFDYWAKKWYIGYYATWTYDLNSEIWDIPLDVEFGYTVYPGITLSAEYIQPLLKEKTYENEFALKFRYLFR